MCLSVLQSLSICTSSDQKTHRRTTVGKARARKPKVCETPPPLPSWDGGWYPSAPMQNNEIGGHPRFYCASCFLSCEELGRRQHTRKQSSQTHLHTREREHSHQARLSCHHTPPSSPPSRKSFVKLPIAVCSPTPHVSATCLAETSVSMEKRERAFSRAPAMGLLRCYQRNAADCVGRLPECDKKALETF